MNYQNWTLLLICLLANTVLLAQDKPEVVVTTGHISNVFAINFSPNNKFVVTGSMDKTVRIWDRSLRQEYRTLYGHKGTIWKVQYTADSKYVMSLDDKDEFIVWEHATGKIMNKIKLNYALRHFDYLESKNAILNKNEKNEVVLTNIFTGKIVKNYGGKKVYTQYRVVDEKTLMVGDRDRAYGIDFLDIETGNIVKKLESDNVNDAWSEKALSSDKKYVAAYTNKDHRIAIWDVATGKLICSFSFTPKMGENIIKMLFTPDAKELLLLARNGTVLVANALKGGIKRRMNKGNCDYKNPNKNLLKQTKVCMPQDMAISPDNEMLGIAATVIINDIPNRFMDNMTGAILFDYEENKELGFLRGQFKIPTHLSSAPNSKYLISAIAGARNTGVRVWNMKEGNLERYIPTSGVCGKSGDETRFAAWVVDKEQKGKPGKTETGLDGMVLTVFDGKRVKPIFENSSVKALNSLALNQDGSILVTQEVDVNTKNPLANQFYYRVWDVNEKKEIKRINIENNQLASNIGMMGNSFRLTPDGKHIVALTNSNKILVWDLEAEKVIHELQVQMAFDYILDFVPNSNRILISHTEPKYNPETKSLDNHYEWYEWDYLTGEKSNIFQPKRNAVLCSGRFSPDGQYLVTGQDGYHYGIPFTTIVWDWATKQPLCELNGHNGAVRYISFDEKNERLYTCADDGFIKVWDLEKCALSASMIAQNKLDYIILSPNNYYKTSKNNNEGIGFRYQSNFYTFDQFDIHYNRPAEVLADLGISKYSTRIYKKAREKRLKRAGFQMDDIVGNLMSLPSINIINKDQIPINTTAATVSFDINAMDKDYPLDRLMVYVNDVPVPLERGVDLRKHNKKDWQQKVTVDLTKGDNLVKVSTFNSQGLESLRESFNIAYEPEKEIKPKLYMMSIGVSEFGEESRNLKFPIKDATDLAKKFKKSNYYQEVVTKEFHNEGATKEKIQQEAKSFLEQATIHDQILVYVSSHGLLDDSLEYYIAMHDIDFNNPSARGLPYSHINQTLDGLACRNRLVLIDACHSGEVDKEDVSSIQKFLPSSSAVKANTKSGNTFIRPKVGLKNSFNYMKALFNDFSKGTGSTVISAAGGFEFALESDEWNNGVFTYAIIQGLNKNKKSDFLNADFNQDNRVTVSELKDFVILQVTKLTNGKQHPTTRNENSINDPVLFMIK